MSLVDQNFVKSIELSYAGVASVLGVTRQAVSRGVKKQDNYFTAGILSQILENYAEHDPVRYKLARKSVANLYPEIANDIFELIDSSEGTGFDTSLPADYTLVTADFVNLMGDLKNCADQVREILSSMELLPGFFTLIVEPHVDQISACRRFRKSFDEIEHLEQRFLIKSCQIDLSLFPTSLMRIREDFSKDIFIAKNSGFEVLDSNEAGRIKNTIKKLSRTGSKDVH